MLAVAAVGTAYVALQQAPLVSSRPSEIEYPTYELRSPQACCRLSPRPTRNTSAIGGQTPGKPSNTAVGENQGQRIPQRLAGRGECRRVRRCVRGRFRGSGSRSAPPQERSADRGRPGRG